MIPTLGLNDLAIMRVLVDLDRTRPARRLLRHYRSTFPALASLRIQDVDYVTQAEAVLTKEVAQFGFKLDFFLQTAVVFQRFQLSKLSGQLLLEGTKFCETRHTSNS